MVMMVGSSRGSRRAAMAVAVAAAAVRVGSLVDGGTMMVVGVVGLTSSRIAAAAADSTATATGTSTGRVRWHLLIRPRLVVMVLMMLMMLTCSTAATTVRRGDAHLLGPVGDLVGEGRRRFA